MSEHDSTVGILGAGLSGILMGMQLRRAGIDSFTIYEKQPDVGGTWYRNTYPGLHCDIPSHLYSYSFEPNPNWSMVYSGQREIQAYLRSCAEKYDLVAQTRFATCVEAARYDEATGSWTLEMADGSTARHRVLVAATGGLTDPRLPRIDGLERFSGPMWHSASWRDDVALAGKRVAVVGSAASAVQVVPEVAKVAAEVIVFSRTPNWIMPRNNRFYSPEEQSSFAGDAQRRLRRRLYKDSMSWYKAFRKTEAGIRELREVCLANLHGAITDPELRAVLTPDYDPGCKRILVSDEYYPALLEDHVTLVPHGVDALTEDAVVAADGSQWAADVVIFCTGYRLGGREDGGPALQVYGRGGRRLIDALAERIEAYRGIIIPGYPNYFTVCGINGTVGYGAVFASAELHTETIARFVARLETEQLRAIEARADVTERYSDALQAELQQMSWTGDCPNFYRNSAGRILGFFPGTVGRMRRELRHIDDADLVLEPF